MEISNFLLWQCAYAELYFTDTKWPDFTTKEFETILKSVFKRERRFGGLGDNSLDKTVINAAKNKENYSQENL